MLKKLSNKLNTYPNIHDWLLNHIQVEETQIYLIEDHWENCRKVITDDINVHLYYDHNRNINGEEKKVRGDSSSMLLSLDDEYLDKELKEGIFRAGLVHNTPYELPKSVEYPNVEIYTSELAEHPQKMIEKAIEEIFLTLKEFDNIRLCSTEFFIYNILFNIYNSSGIEAYEKSTSILWDCVLIATDDKGKESEKHLAMRRRRLEDLQIAETIKRQAHFASDSLRATLPITGVYPIIFEMDAFTPLWDPIETRCSLRNLYKHIHNFHPDDAFLGDSEIKGESLNIYSNALIPFGKLSKSFFYNGLPGVRVPVVENGIIRNLLGADRYAQYLNFPSKGGWTNIEIPPGKTSYEDLLKSNNKIYHIVELSAMMPNSITGDFVGEIRLGYEIEGNKKRPIKGGSISGNIFTALTNAYFSKETVFLGNYLGPKAIRFEELTISGSNE